MDKNIYLKHAVLFFLVTLSFILVMYGHEVWGGVIGLSLLVVLALYLSNMNLLHPLTWFSPTFYLYAVSMPILVGLGQYPDNGAVKETLILEWIALLTFIIVVGRPKRERREASKYSGIEYLKNIKIVVFPIYLGTVLLMSAYMFYVFANGMGKYQIALDQSPLKVAMSFFSIYVLTFFILFGYEILVNKRYPVKLVVFNLFFAMLALLTMGERDLILKLVIGVLFLSHALYRPISKKAITMLGVAIVSLIPVMQKLKSGFLTTGSGIEANQTIIYQLLGSEFVAASRNLSILLANPGRWSHFYGETFIWDIQIAFFKGSNSTLSWFNMEFFPALVARGGGNGFTVVGEGYINFGIFGVVLVFAFLGYLLRFLYRKATKNVFWLVIYATASPIFIYLNRADLANLYSQAGKQIVIPLLIILGAKLFLEQTFNKEKRKRIAVLYEIER